MSIKVKTLPLETEQEDGMSFTELFMMFWRRRVLIVVMTIIGSISGFLVGVTVNATSIKVSTIVEYQWDGINNGEYPNGSRFDYFNAFGPNVFYNSIQDLNINIDSNQLRTALSISPIIPNNVTGLIEAAIERGESYSYFPTIFRYSLDASSISLSEELGKQLLDSLINEFTTEFKESYVDQSVIRNFAFEDFTSYDLLDQVNVINNQIDSMTKLLEDLIKFEPRLSIFRSSSSGFTINDVLAETGLVQSLQLNSLEALIVSNQLAIDPTLTIDRLIFNNRIMAVELAKESQFLTQLILLVENYSGSTNTVIIPGYEGTIDTTSPLEAIYEKIIVAQENIAEIQQNIIYNETLIQAYENNTNQSNSLLITQSQIELELVVENLSRIILNANSLLTEFNSVKNREVTRVLSISLLEPSLNLSITTGIGFISFAFFSLVLAYFISYKNKI
jgi:hypothetical protein